MRSEQPSETIVVEIDYWIHIQNKVLLLVQAMQDYAWAMNSTYKPLQEALVITVIRGMSVRCRYLGLTNQVNNSQREREREMIQFSCLLILTACMSATPPCWYALNVSVDNTYSPCSGGQILVKKTNYTTAPYLAAQLCNSTRSFNYFYLH